MFSMGHEDECFIYFLKNSIKGYSDGELAVIIVARKSQSIDRGDYEYQDAFKEIIFKEIYRRNSKIMKIKDKKKRGK